MKKRWVTGLGENRGSRWFDDTEREIGVTRRKREGGIKGDDVKWNTRKRLVGLKRSKNSDFQKPGCQMSENGDQFIVDGRKPDSTCKLHSVS